jgi:menaquinone-dependent protoporphyrinogen oxidase
MYKPMSSLKKQILILYSTTDGQTLKISRFIAEKIHAETDIVSIENLVPDLKLYDGVIIGASIRYGVHRSKIKKYIDLHYQELNSMPNAFFSVSLISRKPERRTVENNPYVKKFLRKLNWIPKSVGLFGGVLNYPDYSFFDRLMIRFIMNMTQGPTDPSTVIEYTDWKQVEDFATEFNVRLSQILD